MASPSPAYSVKPPAEEQVCFLDINIEHLPMLWFELLSNAVNDYICSTDEEDELYVHAQEWLFLEERDPVLDDKALDLTSFHVVGEAFGVDIDCLRFEVQGLRDRAEYRCHLDPTSRFKDTRGRRHGFLGDRKIEELIERCKRGG